MKGDGEYGVAFAICLYTHTISRVGEITRLSNLLPKLPLVHLVRVLAVLCFHVLTGAVRCDLIRHFTHLKLSSLASPKSEQGQMSTISLWAEKLQNTLTSFIEHCSGRVQQFL